MSKLRPFVLYSETTGNVIPMSLIRRKSPPSGRGVRFLELPDGCCDKIGPIEGKQGLKAFVKLSGNGKVMSGPLVRKKRPVGKWFIQIPYNICCQLILEPLVVGDVIQNIEQETGTTATLNPNVTGGTGTTTYSWTKDGAPISNTTETLNITFTANAVYVQTITNGIGSVTVTYNTTVSA